MFVVGDITGGIHRANCLWGNAIVDAIAFGKIAGERIGKYSDKLKSKISAEK